MNYRRFKLPKKSGGTRIITAPDMKLKIYQSNALPGLVTDYFKLLKKTEVTEVAHGFLPGRNVVTAATKHIGYKTTFMMDIKDFFDTVHIDMFDEWHQDPYLFTKELTCGQGFPTSPMMANIAFIPTLEKINRLLKKELKEFAFTMYADDIQVSCNEENYTDINKIINKITCIIEEAGFKVNPKKTRIRSYKAGWRKILGVNVGDTEVRASRKTMKKLRAAKYQENFSSADGLENWASCNEPKRRSV